jgi:hypothetical protein
MKYCYNCGEKIAFRRKFFIDTNSDIYLKCNNCGCELVDKEKIIKHYIYVGLIFGALLLMKYILNLSFIFSLFAAIITIIYYAYFLPLRKKIEPKN